MLTDVQESVIESIDKILQRQERIDLLVERTEGLNRAVNQFHRSSRVLRRRFWWQNMKCILFFIILNKITKSF